MCLFYFEIDYFTNPLAVQELQKQPPAVAEQATRAQVASSGTTVPIAGTLEMWVHSDEASEEG